MLWHALSHQYPKNENYYQIFKDVTSDYLENNLDKYKDINTKSFNLRQMIYEIKQEGLQACYEIVRISSDALKKDPSLQKNI